MAEFFEKWKSGLAKTSKAAFGQLAQVLGATQITPETWEDLETLLIQADLGIDTTSEILEELRITVRDRGLIRSEQLSEALQAELRSQLDPPPTLAWTNRPFIILVVGVNGSGKTTSIAKLARYYKARGKRVVLAAADTFRAAAIDQLKIWGERTGVEVIAQGPGADPGAVVFDAIRASQETRSADLLIIDTAGRLHTKYNLMKELEKVRSVCARQVHEAPHETLLVLDATTGQNAISQAKNFKDTVAITGIILTKLDGTAKGGIVFAIQEELGVPVRFVGTGEKADDFAEFDPRAFVDGIMG